MAQARETESAMGLNDISGSESTAPIATLVEIPEDEAGSADHDELASDNANDEGPSKKGKETAKKVSETGSDWPGKPVEKVRALSQLRCRGRLKTRIVRRMPQRRSRLFVVCGGVVLRRMQAATFFLSLEREAPSAVSCASNLLRTSSSSSKEKSESWYVSLEVV